MILHYTPARLAAESGLPLAVIDEAIAAGDLAPVRHVGGELILSDAVFAAWVQRQPLAAAERRNV